MCNPYFFGTLLAYADVHPMRKKTESTITVQCLLIIYSTGKEVKQTKKLKTELKELAYLG
jgi:hypothetical protein